MNNLNNDRDYMKIDEKNYEEEAKLFLKYYFFVPAILTIILQLLNYAGIISISWFWLTSPIWIFILGSVEYVIGSIIVQIFE